MKGKVQVEIVSSAVLKGNPLGDPHRREVPVYLPPGCGAVKRRFPVIFYLPGFTGGGVTSIGRKLWKENVVERFDRLIEEGECQPAILVIPDCVTAYGGSQYVNSKGTGRYEDHVADELIPYIDDKFPTVRAPEGRACMGGSSGGFGALWLAMSRPGLFGHAASHSGDMGFAQCYGPDFPKFIRAAEKAGGPKALLKAFRASRDKEGIDFHAINVIGMASCYSPNPNSKLGFDLPFDVRTGELVPAVWRRWLAFDPVELAPRRAAALKRLKTLFIDAGRRDEFNLHLGARRLSDRLRALGVKHLHEEHDGGHFDTAPRLDRSLALLTSSLAAS